MKEQVRFYRKSFHERHRDAQFARRCGVSLALAGWFFLPLALCLYLIWSPAEWENKGMGEVVNVTSEMLVLLGAFFIAYCERRSHEELAKQYERMTSVFEEGAAEIDHHLDRAEPAGEEADVHLAAAQKVLLALGHEAITEHSQWLILRRGRPLELLVH